MTAKSSFNVIGWDDSVYSEMESGAKLSQAKVKKEFRGDLNGSSTAEVLMCLSNADDYMAGAGYVASEVVEGELNGRSGSFIVQHGGLNGPDGEQTFGTIIPGSGTGELEGISGSFIVSKNADGSHEVVIEYEQQNG
ncbi:MAG: DUF3224 domain-containing protein [Rhodothermales bacterium]|nr:DUF3224 domain-containing protein [Rhodothermales bacterium]